MNFMLDFLSLDLQIKHCSVTIYVPVFELNKWTSPSPVVAWIKQIKYYYIDINNNELFAYQWKPLIICVIFDLFSYLQSKNMLLLLYCSCPFTKAVILWK